MLQPAPRLNRQYLFVRAAILFAFAITWGLLGEITFAANAQPAQIWVERATTAMRVDPEASRASAESALDVLKRAPNPDLSIRARLILCDYYGERDYDAAIRELEFAIALLPQATRPGLRAGVLTCQGDTTEAAGDLPKARSFLEQAVQVASDAHDDEMLASALYSRGALIDIQGDFANALVDLQRSQLLYEKLGMPVHALTVHNNIAILYSRMGDYSKALEIYVTTLKAQRKAGMRRDIALTLHNIGRTNEHMQQWEAASQAFNEALTQARDLHYPRGEAYALRGLAATATAQGDPRAALKLLEQASALQDQVSDSLLAARIQFERGVALRHLRRFSESAAALEQARKYFVQASVVIELGDAYEELAQVSAAIGAWHNAYDFRAQAQAVEQALFRNRFDQRFATLKVEYDTAAKEKENTALVWENQANEKLLMQERRVRNWQAAVIGLAAILLTLLAIIAWRQRRASLDMRGLAMTDELTGVPNRRSALRALERLLRISTTTSCAVLLVDIDHFKSINDKHGHPEGDEALKLIAAKLRLLVTPPAALGRLGGEEFIAILPDTTSVQACETAERYRAQIEALDARRWRDDHRITVSIGIGISAPGLDTATTVMQRADAALYAAKHAGRNCVRTEADIETAPVSPQPVATQAI